MEGGEARRENEGKVRAEEGREGEGKEAEGVKRNVAEWEEGQRWRERRSRRVEVRNAPREGGRETAERRVGGRGREGEKQRK